jgi:hypothetical protein
MSRTESTANPVRQVAPPPPPAAGTPPKPKTEKAAPSPAAAPPAAPARPVSVPKAAAAATSPPPSPNKKNLSDLLKNEKAKQSGGKGQQGLEGWLCRENESTGEFVKIWATLFEHRLDYYKDKPSSAPGSDMVTGYLTVNNKSDCDSFDREGSGGFFSNSGQYCFKLSDGTVSVAFSASSDEERVQWVEATRAAIGGVRHTRPEGRAAGTEASEGARPQAMSKRVSAAREGLQAIMELPRKVGELSKRPIKGKFGMKSAKKR